MNSISITTAAIAASSMVAASASAQATLAFDINNFQYEFFDSSGAAGFGGADHDGRVEWSYITDPPTVIADARTGQDGRFGELNPVSLGQSLKNFTGNLEFTSGDVTGGSFTVTLDNDDTYTAQLNAASGSIQELTIGGWTIDGLTFDGAFNDENFGDIDVAELFGQSGAPDDLVGAFFKFRFEPDASASGTADMEVYVLVPLPPAAYAGMATLAGVMGISYLRRRR